MIHDFALSMSSLAMTAPTLTVTAPTISSGTVIPTMAGARVIYFAGSNEEGLTMAMNMLRQGARLHLIAATTDTVNAAMAMATKMGVDTSLLTTSVYCVESMTDSIDTACGQILTDLPGQWVNGVDIIYNGTSTPLPRMEHLVARMRAGLCARHSLVKMEANAGGSICSYRIPITGAMAAPSIDMTMGELPISCALVQGTGYNLWPFGTVTGTRRFLAHL